MRYELAGKTGRGKILPAFALGLFDAVKFTETMVTFYRDDGKIYQAGNGSGADEHRDLSCRPASSPGTFVLTALYHQ